VISGEPLLHCIGLNFVVHSSVVSAPEQQMNVTTIELIDNANGLTVPAELVEDPADDFIETTAEMWFTYKKLRHPFSEHHHWDWKWKLEDAKNRDDFFKCYGVVCDTKPQGLLLMFYGSQYKARLPIQNGKSLIYIAYIESAPWNLTEYTKQRQYSGIGSILLGAAQQFSNRIGFDGRIGLHSLPDTESFYERECNMIKIQQNDDDGLVYYEMTPQISRAFLQQLQRRINNARKQRT
jgi:hypothetical protein